MKTLTLTLGLACLGMRALVADEPVIVHEWGTFTSLQDEQGHAIGGINVDDEPVPNFVWQYANRLVAGLRSPEEDNFGLPPYDAGGKGWISGDPNVTMRLETPVLYFYPPKGQTPQSVPPLDVRVDFHGGILSQYYPYASTNGSLLNGTLPYLNYDFKLTATTTTGLMWKGVRLGVDGKLIPSTDPIVQNGPPWLRGEVVATDNQVWTTPREVSAPLLGVKFSILQGYPPKSYDCTQAEHFLFYRGVGHLDSPLTLAAGFSTDKSSGIEVSSSIDGIAGFDAGWLVRIRPDGTCAFQKVKDVQPEPFVIAMQRSFPKLPASFAESDFSADHLTRLKVSMRDALVKEGLYDDEATAMLKTWDLSYFKSPGLRFFYIVPRAWVDRVLPLSITNAPTEITRVMVGRIELITDAQKAALQRLSDGPCPDLPALKKSAHVALQNSKMSNTEKDAFYRGEKPLADLGIPIPPLIQDYLSLGRFRDALVMQKFWQQKSMPLAQFINQN